MSLSVNQSPTPAPTPDEAAKLINNAAQGAGVQRKAVVQEVETRGAAHQAKSSALLGILEASTFVNEKAREFMGGLIDGQVADVVERAGEGATAIRQTHGGLTAYMIEQSAPHDPTTAPYVASAGVARELPGAFLSAKAGMDATVTATAAAKKRIPDVNVPGGGKPFPPPSQPAPAPAPAPVETAPAPAEGASEQAPAPAPAPAEAPAAGQQTASAREAKAAAQPAAEVVAQGGQPASKEEPRKA